MERRSCRLRDETGGVLLYFGETFGADSDACGY